MIELAKHIEVLLLDNDCVIVPDLGGFITYYQPAHYEEEESLFIPPLRTIGFNPQLSMNDALLIQSYMQVHHTDYIDAQNKIKEKVNTLKDELYRNGTVDICGIGVLNYTIYGTYEFHPTIQGIVSPTLYGLDTFQMTPLTCETTDESMLQHPSIPNYKDNNKRGSEIPWFRNAVAVAVAAILFFILSIPVENTYIEKGNYASLGTDCLFEAIRSQSMVTTLPTTNGKTVEQKHKTAITPVNVRIEKVAPTVSHEKKDGTKAEVSPKTVQKAAVKKNTEPATVQTVKTSKKNIPNNKRHHLIVASLPTSADANKMLQKYQKEGYDEASIVEGNGRFRISLCSFKDKETASKKMSDLKKMDAFADAWILTK